MPANPNWLMNLVNVQLAQKETLYCEIFTKFCGICILFDYNMI